MKSKKKTYGESLFEPLHHLILLSHHFILLMHHAVLLVDHVAELIYLVQDMISMDKIEHFDDFSVISFRNFKFQYNF